jgi:glucosamine kinase
MTTAVAVDLGKTGCRAGLWQADSAPTFRDAPGAAGLAADHGVTTARTAVRAAVLPLLEDRPTLHVSSVCVGAAGAASAPDAARLLAGQLLADLTADEVAVTSDAITAHAGALGGRPGVVLAIGTGSVAIGIGADGAYVRVGGWGPWLGDEGGGAWIGTAGLRAALRAHDGRGPGTALLAAAVDRFGDPDHLPAVIDRGGNPARTAASFAPDVAAAAAAGDAAAAGILGEAARLLASAVLAATRRVGGGGALPVAITGGLTRLGEPLLGPVRTALAAASPPLPLQPSLGSPLDGARLLGLDACTPHEPHVARLRRTTSR